MAGSDVTARQNSSHSHIYLLAWGMVALLAATYLGALIFKPELVERPFGLPLIKQESNEGTRSLSKALAELDALKTDLRKLENEIVELRSQDAVKRRREVGAKRAANVTAPVDHPSASDKSRSPDEPAASNLASNQPSLISPAANEIVARFSESGEDAAAPVRATPRVAAKISTPPPVADIKLINGIKQPGSKRQVASAGKTAIVDKLVAKKNAAKTPVSKAQAARTSAVTTGALRASLGDVTQQSAGAKRLAGKPKPATPAAIAKVEKAALASRRITAPTVDEFGGPGDLTWPAADQLATAAITTGSVKRNTPITFGAPVVRRAVRSAKKPALAVALASGPSVASLRLHWLALTDRFGAELQGLQPRYVSSGKGGDKRYRLVAGPLRSGAEALQICSQLADKNISCTISTVKGRRL